MQAAERPTKLPVPHGEHPHGLCMNKGHGYQEARELAELFGVVGHITSQSEEIQAKRDADRRARRWVVERFHSWLYRFRRLLIRWEE